MEEKESPDPYIQLNLRNQLYQEARAMAEYALANGKDVPGAVIRIIENFAAKDERGNPDYNNIRSDLDIGVLTAAHNTLVKCVKPARPKTILLLDREEKIKRKGLMQFLGPVSLIRQMMLSALICLAFFIVLAMSQAVGEHGGNVMSQFGTDLLLNLLFYLSAAGLGASFAGLYKANSYIANGTFDPTYHASYWIRFFLGLIAGLILAIMVSEEYFNKSFSQEIPFLEKGIVRPLLAILGGFSAELTYTVLNRLIETFQSLFTGSPKSQIEAKQQELKTDFESRQNQQQMSTASNLMQLQQAISKGATTEELNKKIDQMIKETFPGTKIAGSIKIAKAEEK